METTFSYEATPPETAGAGASQRYFARDIGGVSVMRFDGEDRAKVGLRFYGSGHECCADVDVRLEPRQLRALAAALLRAADDIKAEAAATTQEEVPHERAAS